MKMNEFAILLKIAGTFEGIISAATSHAHNIDDVQNAERWGHAAIAYGLSVAGSRSEVATLRKLTEAGCLTTSGMTNGKAHKLTVKGWFTAAAWLGCDGAALRVLLNRVADLQAKSRITLPSDCQTRLCMMWALVPSAGPWLVSLKTPAAIEQFKAEVSEVEGRLIPLIAIGWICRYVSTSGAFWGLSLTEAGRAALTSWPDVEPAREMPGADHEGTYQAWTQGYERGRMLARTNPPDAVKNTIARLLPATSWM